MLGQQPRPLRSAREWGAAVERRDGQCTLDWNAVEEGSGEGGRQIRRGASAFNGLDHPPVGDGPDFVKALEIDHAMDGDVMLAWQMNGSDLPLLNGYPLRLIVPGYYGTYWVKHVSEIIVVDRVFDGFWMSTAYRIPDNECACL